MAQSLSGPKYFDDEQALEAGKSVRWVADVLAHSDPALTLRVYEHAIRSEEEDVDFAG